MTTDILTPLKLLRTPCPPMLFALMDYSGSARFLAIYYAASDARWTDGIADFPWSFWIYNPFIEHAAIAIDFDPDVDLGTDDSYPTHCLLIDRETRKLYLGTPTQVNQILTNQHPPRPPVQFTASHWEKLSKLIQQGLKDLPTPTSEEIEAKLEAQQQGKRELVEWLDSQLTVSITTEFEQRAKAGDINASFSKVGGQGF